MNHGFKTNDVATILAAIREDIAEANWTLERSGDAAWSLQYSSDAKDNFCFERVLRYR